MPKRDGKNNPGDRCRCLGEEAAAATAWGKRKVTKKGGKNRINKNKNDICVSLHHLLVIQRNPVACKTRAPQNWRLDCMDFLLENWGAPMVLVGIWGNPELPKPRQRALRRVRHGTRPTTDSQGQGMENNPRSNHDSPHTFPHGWKLES